MNKKLAIGFLALMFSESLLAVDSTKFVTLIGDKASFIEAEICLTDNIDLSVSADYSSATSVLKEFVNGLKRGSSINGVLKNKTKKLDLLLPVPERFYKEQSNIKFKHAVFWGRYVGLGVQYYYPDKNIHWREDFYCGNNYKNCLIDFEFANDQANKIYENIYYKIVNGRYDKKSLAAAAGIKVTHLKLAPPFGDQDYSGTCPLFINYSIVDLGNQFCLDCQDINEKVRNINDSAHKEIIAGIVSNIRNIQEKKLDHYNDIKKGVTKVIGINNQESMIENEGFFSYISSWKNIRLLGYIKDETTYYVFVEYNPSSEKHGKLEILRFKQKSGADFIIDTNPKTTIGESILYSNYFLDSLAKKYKLTDEKK